MVAMRFLLGVLQSFNNPSSLTLLADYFPLERRSTVNSVQNAGIYIGSGLSSLGTQFYFFNKLSYRHNCY